nr:DUF2061 domain-containing protein [uncultured Cohaesibacter sp.]
MDSTTRTIAKAISWQLTGLVSMTLIGYLFTRSLTASSGIAIASATVSFIFYCFHERLWSRVRWGRMTDLSS